MHREATMIFIPLGDDNTDRTITPVVNYVLIAINILVFVVFQGMGENEKFTYAFSTVPAEIVTGEDKVTPDQIVVDQRTGERYLSPGLQPTPVSVYLTLLTSIFMHGGLMHLAGNMLFLWIFGDNIEDDLGHVKYLCFYLLTGVIASLCHVFMDTSSMIPCLGASGAIAAVMGAYLVQHPGRKIVVLVVRMMTQVPAFVVMGAWFLMQLLGQFGTPSEGGGVAYGAHIGGFIAGLALIKLFRPGPRTHGGASYVALAGNGEKPLREHTRYERRGGWS
jgi:membrane associated rhomboid family serine protease